MYASFFFYFFFLFIQSANSFLHLPALFFSSFALLLCYIYIYFFFSFVRSPIAVFFLDILYNTVAWFFSCFFSFSSYPSSFLSRKFEQLRVKIDCVQMNVCLSLMRQMKEWVVYVLVDFNGSHFPVIWIILLSVVTILQNSVFFCCLFGPPVGYHLPTIVSIKTHSTDYGLFLHSISIYYIKRIENTLNWAHKHTCGGSTLIYCTFVI